MSFKFWFMLTAVLIFGWGIYADYSIEIAKFFVGDSIKGVESAGSWGDTFGAFNGLVSLAGAVFIVRTLLLQQAALADQQKALSLQIADAHRQRFESTFFELLKLLRELRNELNLKHSSKYIDAATTAVRKESRGLLREGTDALTGFIVEMLFNLKLNVADPGLASRSELALAYEQTMTTKIEKTFAPYFRLIYTMLARVRSDNILTIEEKYSYTRLLRSQLTNTELFAIAYNSLSPRSADLETLLVEYRMLKYMPDTPGRRRFEGIFDPTAFLPRD